MKRICLLLATLAAAALSTGCAYYTGGYYGDAPVVGPPHHAPAHGYRRHHHGVDLVYDAGLGVYVVVGAPNVYFYSDRFYRYYDGRWQVAVRFDRGWRPAHDHHLPQRLVRHHRRSYHERHGHRPKHRKTHPIHPHRRR